MCVVLDERLRWISGYLLTDGRAVDDLFGIVDDEIPSAAVICQILVNWFDWFDFQPLNSLLATTHSSAPWITIPNSDCHIQYSLRIVRDDEIVGANFQYNDLDRDDITPQIGFLYVDG